MHVLRLCFRCVRVGIRPACVSACVHACMVRLWGVGGGGVPTWAGRTMGQGRQARGNGNGGVGRWLRSSQQAMLVVSPHPALAYNHQPTHHNQPGLELGDPWKHLRSL